MNQFKIVSLNISEKKGQQKHPVDKIILKENFGIVGDAHADASTHRQVSLLAIEDIETMRKRGIQVKFGDLAENITTEGADISALPVGAHIFIGSTELEVTQIGKECHSDCAIKQQTGECIMPKKGVFAKVITGGTISCESNGSYHI